MARQYCGASGKWANCQVAVSVYAAAGTVPCPLEWALFLPGKWAHDDQRRRRAQTPEEVGHVSRARLAPGLPDRPAGQGLAVPVITADAGHGRSVSFRLALGGGTWCRLSLPHGSDAPPARRPAPQSGHRRRRRPGPPRASAAERTVTRCCAGRCPGTGGETGPSAACAQRKRSGRHRVLRK
ncbi:transposase [Streptomyces sp. NPDC059454]|uniref:transposase n=1 Tax=Streptomyces sp. NPDC059454 TaxID=3346836 RepID=UPI003681F2DE